LSRAGAAAYRGKQGAGEAAVSEQQRDGQAIGATRLQSPVRIRADQGFDLTVCLRPFRAEGPRLDVERIGDTLIVHNYGHGGSGWSLSWGSGTIAVGKAMAGSPREIAVIGCGALGLTAAILAQRSGAKVTIYAREFLPETRSARATGSWSPDSRIALTDAAGPGFAALWEQMARASFGAFRRYLDRPEAPVERADHYVVLDFPADDPRATAPDPLGFATYRRRIEDLVPAAERLQPGSAPFDAPYVYRVDGLAFNLAGYGRALMDEFLAAGGTMQRREFHAPSDLARLNEKVVINCPGYGARTLWQDASIVPVRGQIAWLPPQHGASYSVAYKDAYMLARRDAIVVQAFDGGDMKGYGDTAETPDRSEAERAVATLVAFSSRVRAAPSR
jgi:glycine/D-amino acid oxidase-like deaminating enzyme